MQGQHAHHGDEDGHAHRGEPNRLANETSPYLLQHAYNPVDWYPWGDEAFETARERDVPILLSIGYSTCYWCHVMERETFEDDAAAKLMNDRFICIKLDREERPDVDDIYMTALQMMTGHGGWPLNIVLDPHGLRPFWGGTYFPPRRDPTMGRPGFIDILTALADAWQSRRDDVLAQCDAISSAVTEQLAGEQQPVRIGRTQVEEAVTQLLNMHDPVLGGFGRAPKFPQPVYLETLLTFRHYAGDDATTNAVNAAIRTTLDAMANGGMHDQIGGGFHRYSTDAKWLVPHFEKMLYDNGQMAEVYAKASVVYNDDYYARVARRTCEYVLAEMTSESGAFYSAEDAEVDTHEGQNYVWTQEQIDAELESDDAEFISKVYGVDLGGNFQDPHHPDDPMTNVLFLSSRPDELAKRFGMTTEVFLERVDRINRILYASRAKRKQPGTDDKILTAWNGLMIAGLARTGAMLHEPRYIDAAKKAADFILASLIDGTGSLLRTHRAGESKIDAFLEDYAMLAHGLIEIHRSGTDPDGTYLSHAKELVKNANERFWDDQNGGYFDTLDERSDLFVRTKTSYDGAISSGNSTMMQNLIDLHEISGKIAFADRARVTLAGVSAFLARSPVGAINATRALVRLLAIDEDAVNETFRDAEASPTPVAAPVENPVKIFSAANDVVVEQGKPATLTLKIEIDDGYHINAADPGPNDLGLVGLRVNTTNGDGVKAYADYPTGDVYGQNGELRIHRGSLTLPVVLERIGEWQGSPLLTVTYQACTDTACLAPTTVELDVKILRP